MPRRVLEGDVISDKTDKTITVLVERRYRHPVYKKYVKKSDKYAAHDEGNSCKIGDRVQIVECRPISKTKTWTLLTEGAAPASAPVKKESKKAAPEKSPAEKPAAKKAAPKKTTAKKKDA